MIERPLPDPDEALHQPYWDGAREGRLRVQVCARCRRARWPPRERCQACGGRAGEWQDVRPRGTLFSWIVVRQAFMPALAGMVPYVVAIVELDEPAGIRFLGNLVGAEPERLLAGLAVEAAFEPVNREITLVNWRPVE